MNPVLEKLLILQDRDARLARLSEELSRMPVEKADLERQLKAAVEVAEKTGADSKRIETERRKLEVEADGKGTLVQKYKTQLLEIKNNDQFHALQHEITAAQGEIRKIEDVELEYMEKYEVAQVAARAAATKQKEVTQRIELQQRDLEQKAAVIEKQLNELKQERTHLVVDVEEAILSRYERIFRSKHGEAIVRISHGMCAGCHLKLTAQEIHTAQRDNEMVACTNCGRILYWVPE